MKKKIILAILLLTTLLWIGFIWSNSMDNAEESVAKSSKVLELFESLTDKIGWNISVNQLIIRKLAHFTEFFILSALLCCDCYFIFIRNKETSRRKTMAILSAAPAVSLAVASADELIQLTSPGRGASPVDVAIDFSGASFAYILAVLILFLLVPYFKKRKKHTYSDDVSSDS